MRVQTPATPTIQTTIARRGCGDRQSRPWQTLKRRKLTTTRYQVLNHPTPPPTTTPGLCVACWGHVRGVRHSERSPPSHWAGQRRRLRVFAVAGVGAAGGCGLLSRWRRRCSHSGGSMRGCGCYCSGHGSTGGGFHQLTLHEALPLPCTLLLDGAGALDLHRHFRSTPLGQRRLRLRILQRFLMDNQISHPHPHQPRPG